ncbi:hypothetical protein X801_10405 [Opisthorchis viverrini]|uniref:Uncharacterized protein n=1 Tax=Opisthorchis viverrini TaxID=6198 RepID=A0A1S8WHA3_OPIVI|nr:hypothetical protein X801_10405 [Opisthorchis viverrini]
MNSGDESSNTSTFPLSEEEIADDNDVTNEFPKAEKYKEGDREFMPLNDDWHTCETARLDTTHRTALKTIWKEYVFRDDENDDRGKQDANHILCLSISFDNRRFITGGKDAYIQSTHSSPWGTQAVLQPWHITHEAKRIAAIYRFLSQQAGMTVFRFGMISKEVHCGEQIYGTYVAGNDGLDIDPTKNIILTCSWRRENSLVQLWPFPNFLIEGEREITERENMSYKRPLSRFVYEPLKQVTRGYVAKFDAHYKLILYAGSNKNLVSILDIENNTVIAEVTHLDNGVYSGAVFRDPETPDQLRIIYTSGKGVSLGKINMNI